MKSVALLSLILSLSVACSSTSETNPDNQKPEVDASAEPAADAPADAEKKAGEEAKAEAAKPEESLAAAVAEAGVPAPEAATPAPAPEAPAAEQAAPKAEASSEKIVYPTASLVNLRQGPGKSNGVARVAKFGESISLTGEKKNTWLKTTDGLWVSSLFVSESKPAQANDPVVEAPSAPAQVEKASEQAPVEAPAEKKAEEQAPVDAPASEQTSAPAAAQ